MELRGEALRADLRRICSLERVVPYLAEAHPTTCYVREPNAHVHYDRSKILAAQQRRREKAMAERPEGCLTVKEAATLGKCSTGHVGLRIKSLNINPVFSGIYNWYRREDFVRARILRDPNSPYVTQVDIALARRCSKPAVSELLKRHKIKNHGTRRRCCYLISDLKKAGIL